MNCFRLKEEIEKNTSRSAASQGSQQAPLLVSKIYWKLLGGITSHFGQVKVIHNSIVTHQMFAMRALSWLLGLVAKSGNWINLKNLLQVIKDFFIDGLLDLFCFLSMNSPATYPNAKETIIEESMLADTDLWKGKRYWIIFYQI